MKTGNKKLLKFGIQTLINILTAIVAAASSCVVH